MSPEEHLEKAEELLLAPIKPTEDRVKMAMAHAAIASAQLDLLYYKHVTRSKPNFGPR